MLKILTAAFLFFLLSCSDTLVEQPLDALMKIPNGFPAPEYPADNAFTPERWALGKKLFFDPVMSRDMTLSCSSCHLPQHAFTDKKNTSQGIESRVGKRNAPTLANVAYHPYLTSGGGVPSLEMQILVPVQEHAEFDFNILLIAERLTADSTYVRLSRDAYGRDPDAFVITRAISCFERTLISGNSDYDMYINGARSSLDALEIQGRDLFFSERLACSQCHGGFNFTNYTFENNGLYAAYEDPGRFRLTGDPSDIARFKVPTLRNIAVTAPYMHDGSFSNLDQVIEHYNSGAKDHPHKSHLIKPLNLSAHEKAALKAFLHSLTDEEFLSNPNFTN